jgi:hypothetical protein
MRKWLKEIFRQVVREEIENCPLIVSNRAPNANDVYAKGTTWTFNNEEWLAARVTVEWKKVDNGISQN